jgi:hypothetical protein
MGHIASWRTAVDGLRADLESVVGPRLRALVVYEAHGIAGDMPGSSEATRDAEIRHEDLVHTLAIVDDLGVDDLTRLAALAPSWERQQLAVPLLLAPRDLARSLDSFPLEFAQILARHVLVFGEDPFLGLQVERQDLRRACETQARSHLVHLREGYLQTGGDARAVADLVAASAAPLRALLVNIARLHGVHPRTPDELVHFLEERLALPGEGLRPVVRMGSRGETLQGPQIADVFPRYFNAVERLARLVDEWAL